LKPFAVGVPVNGYLLEGDGSGRFVDVTEEYAPSLLDIGLITDAIWADLTGDNQPELIVTGEWMPIHIYEMGDGEFNEITEELGLSGTSGLWNALEAGDINGDGRVDLVAGNHGQNSMFEASVSSPVKMYVGDLSQNGMIDQVIATEKKGEYYPLALRHEMIEVIPSLSEKYPTYASYAGQTINDIFSQQQLENTMELNASNLESVVFWNTENGLIAEVLPRIAQQAPIYGIEIEDLNGDGKSEIILGGNLYDVKPQVGPYDASRGVVIGYQNNEFDVWPHDKSGLNIEGEIRKIKLIEISGERHLLIARHNNSPVFLIIRD
jgi:hypothetical protein